MVLKGYLSLSFLVLLASLAASSHGQSPPGFVSIDCGITPGKSYIDPFTNLTYVSDENYVHTGVNRNVSLATRRSLNMLDQYYTLRCFPTGSRNCYTLWPAERGKKYLVRAIFLYGNYDGLNQPPAFDLYLGVNLWTNVDMSEYDSKGVAEEIIAVATADSVPVCVANTGYGVPFFSLIELRPLPDEIHQLVNAFQSLYQLSDRLDYGLAGPDDGTIVTRYPDDPHDRRWFPVTNSTSFATVNSDLDVADLKEDGFQIPHTVMKTAATTAGISGSLDFSTVASGPEGEVYVFLHFAELNQLGVNETREMDVYVNGRLWKPGISPAYLVPSHVFWSNPTSPGWQNFSIRASNRSTLPPILNALEVHRLIRLEVLPTNSDDVVSIQIIKDLYQIKRNWDGDPCAPQLFIWEGVDCTYEATPMITSLNLSSSGLTGVISPLIANLTNLRSLKIK